MAPEAPALTVARGHEVTLFPQLRKQLGSGSGQPLQ